MYRDMSEKLKYHKENILKSLIKRGIYPTDIEIKTIIESIDLSIAYLKVQEAKPAQKFDAKVHSSMISSIYEDLKLLYNLLYRFSIEEYATLNAFIDTHLDSLENNVKFYKSKSKEEISTTSLGETVLFKSGDFSMKTFNNVIEIGLGKVKLRNGSKIASIINAPNLSGEDAIFIFKNEKEELKISPYNYSQSFMKVPGEIEKKEHLYMAENQQNGISTKMEIDAIIDSKNKYLIMSGKDKIFIKEYSNITRNYTKYRPTKFDMVEFNSKTYIDFYTCGAKSITFRFNKKPISTNFSMDNYTVSDLDNVHHFFIECDAGFSFDFDIEGGSVYAMKSEGVVYSNGLYFNKKTDEKDFLIYEYRTSNTTEYDAYINIWNKNAFDLDIDSIVIKELLAVGGA